MRSDLLVELDGRLSASGIRQRKRALRRHSFALTAAKHSGSVLRRVFDILFSAFLLLLFSPLLLFGVIAARLSGGGIRREERLGRWASRFGMYQLEFPPDSRYRGASLLENLPALLNVVRGEMALIGPRPATPTEGFAEKRIAWKRYSLRPGLLSLWWIRKRANIAFGSEASLDVEYVETTSFRGDLGMAVRAIPAGLFGGEAAEPPAEIHFLGIRVHNLSMADASAEIVRLAREPHPAQVCFVNADCVNIACVRPSYHQVLDRAELVLADGIGVRLAGKLLKQPVRENVNGTDMLPHLCAALEDAGLCLYLLGGKPGIADGVKQWIEERYPGLRVCGAEHGFFTAGEEPAVLDRIARSGADVVLVAFGAPRQDEWIAAHRDTAGARVMIGVGGLFDFYSGRIPRAPVWVRELGMEWLYRFYQEPRRMFRRYFGGSFIFLSRVLIERMRKDSRAARGKAA